MRDQYIRTGGGFLLVYSIANRETFDVMEGMVLNQEGLFINACADFRDQILRVKDSNSYPMVLIGNKCDLEDQRRVSTNEGNELAKKFGCRFFEGNNMLPKWFT